MNAKGAPFPLGARSRWPAEAANDSASLFPSAQAVGDPDCVQPCCRSKPAALLRGSTHVACPRQEARPSRTLGVSQGTLLKTPRYSGRRSGDLI